MKKYQKLIFLLWIQFPYKICYQNTIVLGHCDGPSILKHVHPGVNTLIFTDYVNMPNSMELTWSIRKIVTFVDIKIWSMLPTDRKGLNRDKEIYMSIDTLAIFNCETILNRKKDGAIFI